jgi:predicted DNA-binding transcriptional regulator AlpA
VINVEYEFLFVVTGVSVDDGQAAKALTSSFDGLLSWHRGLERLAVSSEGAGAMDALHQLLERIAAEVPALRILRLDPDLVGVPDIADRTGHSRQNVQQWVNGERNGDPSFPPPEGTAGRSLVWRWAEVNAWLRPLGLDDHAIRPTREESAFLDVELIQWNHAHRGELGFQSGEEAGDRQAVPQASSQAPGGQLSSGRLRHSPETHRNLVARIPIVTGRDLREWFARIESAPAFLRAEGLAGWLSDEHGLSPGYASAIVHEYALREQSALPPRQRSGPGTTEQTTPKRP